MKKLAFVPAFLLVASALPFSAVSAAEEKGMPADFAEAPALYVHAVSDSADNQAWQVWQSAHDEDFYEEKPYEKYFFLPTSAGEDNVDVYNGFNASVTLNGVAIASHETESVPYSTNESYSVNAGGKTYTLRCMKSNAEAAVYINNPDPDGKGSDLLTYLNENKENKTTATGAIVTPDGTVDNTVIKKIKGRGNTSWTKPKKGYNITYDKKVSIAGMEKNKKYSILPNYQDDSLSRNRILYDLSDAVGMPYASDSRYVDFYINGYYCGSYLMAEKIEPGSLVTDVTGEEYLNEDGTVKEDFPFIAEVDPSAGGDDYYVTCSGNVKVAINAPELEPGDAGYEEVKEYVREKYDELLKTCRSAVRKSSVSIADLIDIDSAAKLFLINELGKNWDAGVSSTFFTYKQDKNGNYKFFASPVWDYDNTLGNAVGLRRDLQSMGVTDYEKYTGWWCRFKGKSSSEHMSYNIINNFARNKEITQAAAQVWFEKFVPALKHFSGEKFSARIGRELYTRDEYSALVKESAEMNYQSGWLLDTGDWIADHSNLKKAVYDEATKTMIADKTATRYTQSFQGMFDYACDWMLSRAAWLSEQFAPDYIPSALIGDVNLDGIVNVDDATELQSFLAEYTDLTDEQLALADTDGDGTVDVRDVTQIQRYLAEFIDELG